MLQLDLNRLIKDNHQHQQEASSAGYRKKQRGDKMCPRTASYPPSTKTRNFTSVEEASTLQRKRQACKRELRRKEDRLKHNIIKSGVLGHWEGQTGNPRFGDWK